MKDSDKPKLVIALVLLVVAGGVMLWYFGVFGGGTTQAPAPIPTDAPRSGGPRAAPGSK